MLCQVPCFSAARYLMFFFLNGIPIDFKYNDFDVRIARAIRFSKYISAERYNFLLLAKVCVVSIRTGPQCNFNNRCIFIIYIIFHPEYALL